MSLMADAWLALVGASAEVTVAAAATTAVSATTAPPSFEHGTKRARDRDGTASGVDGTVAVVDDDDGDDAADDIVVSAAVRRRRRLIYDDDDDDDDDVGGTQTRSTQAELDASAAMAAAEVSSDVLDHLFSMDGDSASADSESATQSASEHEVEAPQSDDGADEPDAPQSDDGSGGDSAAASGEDFDLFGDDLEDLDLFGDDPVAAVAAEETRDETAAVAGGEAGRVGAARVIDARAHAMISQFPPRLCVSVGKTAATRVELILCGDLVHEISSPLFVFRLNVRLSDATNIDSPYYVESIDRVLSGPCVAAVLAGAVRSKNRGIVASEVGVVRTASGESGASGVVTVGDIRKAVRKSGYLSRDGRVRDKILDKLLSNICADIPGARGKAAASIVPHVLLERYAPVLSSSAFAYACRNVHASANFFACANRVGGGGVRALHANATTNTPAVWTIVMGGEPSLIGATAAAADDDDDDGSGAAAAPVPVGLLGDSALDTPIVLAIVETVAFATPPPDPARLSRFLVALGATDARASPDLAACTELTVRAAAIFHALPQRTARGTSSAASAHATVNGVKWGDRGEPWPEAMRNVLRAHGVFTAKRGGDRWFACWHDAREYFERAARTVTDTVTFVRSETDDDDDNSDAGFIAHLLGIELAYTPHVVLATLNEGRSRYIGAHTEIVRWVRTCAMRAELVTSEDTVVIDRAHQLDGESLVRLIGILTQTAKVARVVVCGSMWASGRRGDRTMFSQLYAQAPSSRKTVANAALSPFKVADGRDPRTEPTAVPAGAAIFVLTARDARTREDESSSLRELRAAFPRSKVTTPYDCANGGWGIEPAAIVVLDPEWTREDLSIVWQCTTSRRDAIWFVGGDWREVIKREGFVRSSVGGTLL